MSFRTVVITKTARLNYKNRYLVVKNDLDEKYIHISEIDTLIIDSISVSLTSYLLKELLDNKINIIFCDDKHNPYSELIPFYSRYNTSKQIKHQINWSKERKNKIWKNIVKNKIKNQASLIKKIDKKRYLKLVEFVKEVQDNDATNREGHAAKVYFNTLFGNEFSRDLSSNINSALNYGYAVLLSTINKEVINNGYITQLGIFHKSEFNQYNLSCDLMEPFRPIIDNFVYYNKDRELDSNYKMDIVNIFNTKFKYNRKQYTLKDIIKKYVYNTLQSLTKKTKYEEFYYEG